MAEHARSQPATLEIRAAILGLIGQPIYPYLITTTRASYPYSRPLLCVNDGFRIWMVTRRAAIKVLHLRRNPHASLLWVDASGAQPVRSVLLQGEVTILDELAAVEEFARRYAAKNPDRRRSWTPAENPRRVVLELRPTFCRADWFAGFVPVVLCGEELAVVRRATVANG